jgi:hypothetical protein
MATVAALDLAICVVMRLMGAVDRGQRWFFLHSLTNWLVVLTGIKDVIVTLDSPVNSMNPDQPWLTISILSPPCPERIKKK